MFDACYLQQRAAIRLIPIVLHTYDVFVFPILNIFFLKSHCKNSSAFCQNKCFDSALLLNDVAQRRQWQGVCCF